MYGDIPFYDDEEMFKMGNKTELTFEQRIALITKQTQGTLKIIRAAPRPILAILIPLSWVLFLFICYSSGGDIGDVPTIYTGFTGAILAEYFGERMVLTLLNKK